MIIKKNFLNIIFKCIHFLQTLNNYNVYEIILFICMGVIGGLLGAGFVKLNVIITKFRLK